LQGHRKLYRRCKGRLIRATIRGQIARVRLTHILLWNHGSGVAVEKLPRGWNTRGPLTWRWTKYRGWSYGIGQENLGPLTPWEGLPPGSRSFSHLGQGSCQRNNYGAGARQMLRFSSWLGSRGRSSRVAFRRAELAFRGAFLARGSEMPHGSTVLTETGKRFINNLLTQGWTIRKLNRNQIRQSAKQVNLNENPSIRKFTIFEHMGRSLCINLNN